MADQVQLHVVGVGAHPDDVAVGAGGIIASYVKRGHKATILNISYGETVWPPERNAEAAVIRKKEGEDIARVLGADVVCLEHPNTHIIPTYEMKSLLVDELRKLRANIILFTTPWDTHADHRNLSWTMRDVMYYVGHKGMAFGGYPPCDLRSAWMYQIEATTEEWHEPDLLFDISDVWDVKAASLTDTRPIFANPNDTRDMCQVLNAFYGLRCGVKYAEALYQSWGSMALAQLTRDRYRVTELPLIPK